MHDVCSVYIEECDEGVRFTSPEGVVEICNGGFRGGLCCEDLVPEAAITVCRQLGFNTSNPGTDFRYNYVHKK